MNVLTKNSIIEAYYRKVLRADYDPKWWQKTIYLQIAMQHLVQLEQENPYLDLEHCHQDQSKLNRVLCILNYYDKNRKKNPDIDCLSYAYLSERKIYTADTVYHGSPVDYTKRQYTDSSPGLELYQQGINKLEILISACSSVQQQQLLQQDLAKLQSLRFCQIPQADGKDKPYFELAESAGGVTEKKSLVSQGKVIRYLKFLCDKNTNREKYLEKRSEVKLSTEAIIKLPKAGKTTEVQRELIALNIAEILGFNTTKRCMIEYDGKPALFIAFDDIRLLNDYVEGESQTKLLGLSDFGGKYLHYSTIKPVGEGLSSDSTIEDMGLSLAYFYLCSDTDAIGGYNQNKALIDDKYLYFFDQVVMAEDKLGLDSRFSMKPIKAISKHTRHDQGRNRTVIEDSQFERKFLSLIHLQNNRLAIETMMNKIIAEHEDAINNIGSNNSTESQDKIEQLEVLLEDAKKIKQVLVKRIDTALDFLPPFTSSSLKKTEKNKLTMHAMMFEKLVNKPVLFADDGRPYRNPWTSRHSNKLINIRQIDGQIELEFSQRIRGSQLAVIAKHLGLKSTKYNDSRKIRLSADLLMKIDEHMLFAETKPQLQHEHDYLEPADLKLLAKSYPKGNRGDALKVIKTYQNKYSSHDLKLSIKCIEIAQSKLEKLLNSTPNKGFIRHLQKRLQYDIQQKLFHWMGQHKPDNVEEAFAAAVKLDRVTEFNRVCQRALLLNEVNSDDFKRFLDTCIDLDKGVNNHVQAEIASSQLSKQASDCLNTNELSAELPMQRKKADLSLSHFLSRFQFFKSSFTTSSKEPNNLSGDPSRPQK